MTAPNPTLSPVAIPNWRNALSDRDLLEIDHAREYMARFRSAGTVGHNHLLIIATLAAALDAQELVNGRLNDTLADYQNIAAEHGGLIVALHEIQTEEEQGQSFGLEVLTQDPAALRRLFFAVLAAAPAIAKFSKEATTLLSELSEGELTTEQAFERLKGLVTLLAPIVALVP